MGSRVICDLFHRLLDLISNKLIFYRQRLSSKCHRQQQVFTDLRKCICSSVGRQRPPWGSRHSFAQNSNEKRDKQTSWVLIYDRSEVCNACIKHWRIFTQEAGFDWRRDQVSLVLRMTTALEMGWQRQWRARGRGAPWSPPACPGGWPEQHLGCSTTFSSVISWAGWVKLSVSCSAVWVSLVFTGSC